ncbi:MAG: adenosylcobinamide-GDP ribazoletransferase [Bacteroidetes bacterium RIFCSPLOWO2_12_FULL_35_15]|nr:MAG: adenosylcobinamide-GDP ribazoletransferase [Bacteroidetes bacterium RIFCSPLOWO2_12_FULL_35_15]
MLKNELKIFFTAVMFYTRIPCPKWVNHEAAYLNKSTRYFPLIGWIVGGSCALVFYATSFFLTKELALIISFITGILMTGAFHEDGFADVCDGFGGGWTKQKILDIMKDSRVGAYGVIGLICLFLFKFYLLLSIESKAIPFVIFSAHAYSRFCAASFILTHDYVRENEDSKAKPIAKSLGVGNFMLTLFFGVSALLVFKNIFVFILIIPVYIIKIFLGRYYKKWIGGYTGDCLGATQQICEVGFYLFYILLWKFIS